ncbi:MAG TPA: carboxypeptidase-like regulatory domain-containing protein, partial [Vicinamibacterales bacterium]|nr:carboxypeptidase-like regulatory domain-containing protein [Vicinamibacterales bacterium]
MIGGQGKGLRFAGCVLAILLAGAAIAFAQGNGVITGTVVDKDGVVPGATITATDTATGIVRKAVSDDRGVFRLLSVPPGRYRINVEVEGFKTITVDDFPLLLGESRDLGKLTMTVGALTESLTVTAEVTPVQTSASQLQRTVTGDQLTMIQVKGRDIFGMMKILPGVVDTTASRD